MIRSLIILFCATLAVFAQEDETQSAGATNRPQYNFLFVIDVSMSMNQRKPAAIKMVREVIESKFNGQIEPGDSIDFWTFNSANHIAQFPPHIWEEAEMHRIATIAARFVDRQKFTGRSRFLPVAADLESLLPHAKHLLVFVITDAEPPVAGISLDLAINENVAKEKKLRPGSKNPLLISLAATNGKFAEWAVFNGEGQLDLATLPTRPKPLPVLAEVAPQKMVEPTKEPEPAPPIVIDYPPGTRITQILPPKPEPVEVIEPKVETAEIATEPAKIEVVETKTDENEIVATVTAPPAAPKADPGNPTKEKEIDEPKGEPVATVLVERRKEEAVETKSVAKISPSSGAATTPPLVETKSAQESKNVPSSKVKVTPESEPTVALTAPSVPTSGIYIAIVTGLSFLAIGGFLILRRLRSRHGASIISKSLQQ